MTIGMKMTTYVFNVQFYPLISRTAVKYRPIIVVSSFCSPSFVLEIGTEASAQKW